MAAVKKFEHEAVLFKAALVAGIKYAESFDLECQRRRRATNRNRLPRLTVKVARLQFFVGALPHQPSNHHATPIGTGVSAQRLGRCALC